MEIMTIINAIANLIISLSTSAFIVFVFGRFTIMDKLPKFETFTIKFALCLLASGSLWSFVSMTTPPLSEVLMNCGLALTFLWASIFHYKHFVKKK